VSSDTLETEIETGERPVESVLGDQSTVLEFGLLVSIAENNAGQSPFANHRPTRRAMVGDKEVIESGELKSSRWRRF